MEEPSIVTVVKFYASKGEYDIPYGLLANNLNKIKNIHK
jgi:hypothetical protein